MFFRTPPLSTADSGNCIMMPGLVLRVAIMAKTKEFIIVNLAAPYLGSIEGSDASRADC
jgi:hypothetical protein